MLPSVEQRRPVTPSIEQRRPVSPCVAQHRPASGLSGQMKGDLGWWNGDEASWANHLLRKKFSEFSVAKNNFQNVIQSDKYKVLRVF